MSLITIRVKQYLKGDSPSKFQFFSETCQVCLLCYEINQQIMLNKDIVFTLALCGQAL